MQGKQIKQFARRQATDKVIMGFTALVMIGVITIIVLNLVGVVGDDQVRTLALL